MTEKPIWPNPDCMHFAMGRRMSDSVEATVDYEIWSNLANQATFLSLSQDLIDLHWPSQRSLALSEASLAQGCGGSAVEQGGSFFLSRLFLFSLCVCVCVWQE